MVLVLVEFVATPIRLYRGGYHARFAPNGTREKYAAVQPLWYEERKFENYRVIRAKQDDNMNFFTTNLR